VGLLTQPQNEQFPLCFGFTACSFEFFLFLRIYDLFVLEEVQQMFLRLKQEVEISVL